MEVSQSLDENSWQKVVDYSNYACRSWQTLYFPARIIRYIRVVGTRSSVGKHFHLITFQCLYTREKFTVQNDLLVSVAIGRQRFMFRHLCPATLPLVALFLAPVGTANQCGNNSPRSHGTGGSEQAQKLPD